MKTKKCTGICGLEKPETEEFFYFRKERNKFRNECKKCMNNRVEDFYELYPWKRILKMIKYRCNSSKATGYNYYGGRGIECKITVEEVEFLWFRDKAYNLKQPSIDRENNDGNYELSNCRFIEKGLNTAERNIRVSSKPILQFDLNDNLIQLWNSQSEASRVLKIDQSSISKALCGKSKTAYKYKWRYKN